MSWQERGECVGLPVDWWFSDIPSYESRARWLCSICPVRVRCIQEAVANGDRGIRGGLSYRERAKKHKRPLIHRTAA